MAKTFAELQRQLEALAEIPVERDDPDRNRKVALNRRNREERIRLHREWERGDG